MEYTDPSIIDNLLKEYYEQRNDLKKMILELEKIKSNIDKLFPDKLDARYLRFFDEKVKSATSMFNLLLDIRKEISKNLKDEIDIRTKLDKKEKDESELGSLFDIAELAAKVEKLQKNNNKINNKIVKLNNDN